MPRPSDPHARDRLLDAARVVFSDKGLDRAKVEDITSLAQLSKGAFYLHFESKEDAFRELLAGIVSHLERLLDVCVDGQLATLPTSFPEYLHECHVRNMAIFEFIWENRALMAMVLEGGGSASYGHLIEDFAIRAQRDTAALLKHGVEVGLYREDLNLEPAAAFIAGGYDRIARQLVRESVKPDLDTLLLEVQRQLLGGVARPEVLAELGAGPKSAPTGALQKLPGSEGVERGNDLDELRHPG